MSWTVDRFAQLRRDRNELVTLFAATAPFPRYQLNDGVLTEVQAPLDPEREKTQELIRWMTQQIIIGEQLMRMTPQQQRDFDRDRHNHPTFSVRADNGDRTRPE